MRKSDLEQLVIFQNQLNPDIWHNGEMKLPVRVALLRIAKSFVKFIDVADLRLTDITVSGSNAGFNYNRDSDIDLHLIADVNGACGKVLKDLFMSKKSEFNDQHNITILGHDVEVYVQDSDEVHISNGIYSVLNGKWIKKPRKITERPDVTNVENKVEYLKQEIEQAISSGDPDTITRLKHKIKKMRMTGLERSGELSSENLAFKLLRNTGELEKLWQAEKHATDKSLSLG